MVLLETKLYVQIAVDRSQTTNGGEGTAGHTFDMAKWGLLARPASVGCLPDLCRRT